MAAASWGALQVLCDERLSEGDGGGLEEAAARVAVRILITIAHAFEHDLDGAAIGAVEAGEVAHRPVYLDDALGGGSGIVVKAVDVLGDERVELAFALELGKREVAGIRLSGVHGAPGAIRPGADAVVAVGHVVLDGGGPFGGGVLRPDTLGAAKVGDSRVSRDTGAGQDDNRAGLAQQGRDRVDIDVAHGASLPESGASRHRPVL